jgi:hypothetical protein
VERLIIEPERVSRGVAVVLLFSSVLTGFMGMGLLVSYEASAAYYHGPVFYPALYVGVLNLFACALCVAGGAALLKRRFLPLTLASVFLLLASGIAAPIAWSLGGYIWLNGLFFGGAQIGVSLIALFFLIALKVKK